MSSTVHLMLAKHYNEDLRRNDYYRAYLGGCARVLFSYVRFHILCQFEHKFAL
jgi:hypothetical protein